MNSPKLTALETTKETPLTATTQGLTFTVPTPTTTTGTTTTYTITVTVKTEPTTAP